MDIQLLGQSLRISTDEDNQYVSRLVGHFQDLIDTVQRTTANKNNHIVAILAGLLAIDEYYKTKERVEPDSHNRNREPHGARVPPTHAGGKIENGISTPPSPPPNEPQAKDEAAEIASDILSKIEKIFE